MLATLKNMADMNTLNLVAKYEVFTAAKIQVEVFWILTPCSDAIAYRRFGGPCFLHLHGT
jgi:hypothetical protein